MTDVGAVLAELSRLASAFLPLIPIIVGLVEFAKLLGLPSDAWAAGFSVGLGIVLAVAVQITVVYPVVGIWMLVVIAGTLVGMSATGLYTIGARWAKR